LADAPPNYIVVVKGAGRDQLPRWEFFKTAAGKAIVEKELSALPPHALGPLAELQRRYVAREHRPGEVETLGDGLFALRVASGGAAIRLYFGIVEGGAVYLAVRALNKKSKKAPPSELKLARSRLREWQQRRP
jgi:phage-related protein